MRYRTSQVLLKHALGVAKQCDAQAIFMPLLFAQRMQLQIPDRLWKRCVFLAPNGAASDSFSPSVIYLPDVLMMRASQIKLAIFLAVSRHLVDIGDLVVFLTGDLMTAEVDTILVPEISSQSQIFAFIPAATVLAQSVLPEVMARMLDLAVEIGTE